MLFSPACHVDAAAKGMTLSWGPTVELPIRHFGSHIVQNVHAKRLAIHSISTVPQGKQKIWCLKMGHTVYRYHQFMIVFIPKVTLSPLELFTKHAQTNPNVSIWPVNIHRLYHHFIISYCGWFFFQVPHAGQGARPPVMFVALI